LPAGVFFTGALVTGFFVADGAAFFFAGLVLFGLTAGFLGGCFFATIFFCGDFFAGAFAVTGLLVLLTGFLAVVTFF
jgi:hypothetical protein